ncbi:MAG: hypothetical protein ABSH20_08305 [Tepidisphaeraceae bacterium]|jgi:hypothetical protein
MWNCFNSKPSCPIAADEQQWIDFRFRWLEAQLGQDRPRKQTVVLPTPEFFPDRYDATPEDAQVMLNRVAGYMGVNPERFELFMYSQGNHPLLTGAGGKGLAGADGLYIQQGTPGGKDPKRSRVGLEASQLADPLRLVATLAHEIAHEILLGEGRISSDEHDHEPLTDLLTVFVGLGVFTANATIRDRGWSQGLVAGWSIGRHGYLDQHMLGYGLAKFASFRGETQPPWAKHVRPDVRVVLKDSLRFLQHAAS